MQREDLYQELEAVLDQLGIQIREESFHDFHMPANSGLCTIKGQPVFLMDKSISLSQKTKILGKYLSNLNLDHIYLKPAVRGYLEGLQIEETSLGRKEKNLLR
jgi:hypothetical protein